MQGHRSSSAACYGSGGAREHIRRNVREGDTMQTVNGSGQWRAPNMERPAQRSARLGAEFEQGSDPTCLRVPRPRKSGRRRPGRLSRTQSILSPSCRSLADAGATRSRRVSSSPSWSSVSHCIPRLQRASSANAHVLYAPRLTVSPFPHPPVIADALSIA